MTTIDRAQVRIGPANPATRPARVARSGRRSSTSPLSRAGTWTGPPERGSDGPWVRAGWDARSGDQQPAIEPYWTAFVWAWNRPWAYRFTATHVSAVKAADGEDAAQSARDVSYQDVPNFQSTERVVAKVVTGPPSTQATDVSVSGW